MKGRVEHGTGTWMRATIIEAENFPGLKLLGFESDTALTEALKDFEVGTTVKVILVREPDLGLTWQDAQDLFLTAKRYFYELDHGDIRNFPSSTKQMYEEVLFRWRYGNGEGGQNL